MTKHILFVGCRLGALKAAEKVGLQALVLHDRPIPAVCRARILRSREVGLDEREQVVAAASEVCCGEQVAAVVGVSEGSVPAAAWVREALGLAGNSSETARRCTDKVAMKQAAVAAGIPCARWLPITAASEPAELVAELGLPMMLKRARASGSRGLARARTEAEVAAALASRDLAESWVTGREMSIETLVAGGQPIFVNPTEYLVPLHASILPAALPDEVLAQVLDLNQRVLAAMGVERGMTHLELFLTQDGPVFGEVAARPPGGRLMPLLARAYGFDPWRALVDLERGETPRIRRKARRTAGSWLLHPGPGIVKAVPGLEAARALPGIRRIVCRVTPGDQIAPRIGSGQDIGHIDAVGPDRETVAAALQDAHATLRITLARSDQEG